MALTSEQLQQIKDYGAIIIKRLQPDIESANINRHATVLQDVFVGAAQVDEQAALDELAALLTAAQERDNRAAQRETNNQTVRDRVANSAYASMTAAEIVQDVQAEIDAWASLADAKTTLRKLLPFIAAGVMHNYRDV